MYAGPWSMGQRRNSGGRAHGIVPCRQRYDGTNPYTMRYVKQNPRVWTGVRATEVEEDYLPPSNRGSNSELDALERFSVVIPDTQLSLGTDMVTAGDKKKGQCAPKSGVVSRRILAGVMANPTCFGRMKFSIEQARLYKNEELERSSGRSRSQLQVDKALVNVAGLLVDEILDESTKGRVSIEVDPRLAYDVDGLVRQGGEVIWSMCAEIGIPMDRILIQMPATWEAMEAAKRLELQGLETHLIGIYSYEQAVAASDHDVSVIQVNVGRINDWFDKNPGAVRDPNGPREVQAMAIAGYGGPLENPGLPMVKKIYTYMHHAGGKTKVVASGMRTKKETLALAGCDYLVVGEHILKSLKSTSTLDGYNDGLRAAQDTDYRGSLQPAMSPELAAEAEIDKVSVYSGNFSEALGLIGRDLLSSDIQRAVEDATRLEPIFLNRATGQE